MLLILGVVVSLAASIAGFRWARRFVTGRLRYVDIAQRRMTPIVAGLAAAAIVIPFTWLPLIGLLVTGGTALSFGIGVGLGVASASKEIRLASYRVDRW